MLKNNQFHILLLFLFTQHTYSQTTDTISFRLNSRLSFHTYEKSAEMLLHVPQNLIYNYLSVSLKINNDTICSWKGVPGKRILRIPFDVNLQPADYKIIANITTWNRNIKYMAATDLIILDYKSNEVKTDRLTGGLIVNRISFFPFGFYCYSPVFRTLPEEEAVRGFNMMSPYQRILPELIDRPPKKLPYRLLDDGITEAVANPTPIMPAVNIHTGERIRRRVRHQAGFKARDAQFFGNAVPL